MEYSFTVILDPEDKTLDDLEGVYEKANDSLLYVQNGSIGLDFYREAESLEEAIASAVRDLESLGFKAKRVERSCPNDVEPGYWDELMKKLRALPDAVEAPEEDPEPFV